VGFCVAASARATERLSPQIQRRQLSSFSGVRSGIARAGASETSTFHHMTCARLPATRLACLSFLTDEDRGSSKTRQPTPRVRATSKCPSSSFHVAHVLHVSCKSGPRLCWEGILLYVEPIKALIRTLLCFALHFTLYPFTLAPFPLVDVASVGGPRVFGCKDWGAMSRGTWLRMGRCRSCDDEV